MQLVMLAAGRGQRFGGLKQLAAVGPGGEAIMDYTVRAAQQVGFTSVVLVVRAETLPAILAHVDAAWPADLSVEVVLQHEPTGTVPAVLAARAVLRGPFVVANADDLYDAAVLDSLRRRLEQAAPARAQVVACYELVRTVLTGEPVKRGLCVTNEDLLADVVEYHVRLRRDGGFEAWPLRSAEPAAPVRLLSGREPVSMNLWGFEPTILDHLEAAVDSPPGGDEILLPDVLGALVRDKAVEVRLCHTSSRCIGLTHREDLAPLREQLASLGALGALGGTRP